MSDISFGKDHSLQMLSWVNLSQSWMRGIGIESREKTRSLRLGGGAVTPFFSAIHSNSASPEGLISGGKSDRGAAAPLQVGSRIKALEIMVDKLHRVIAEVIVADEGFLLVEGK